MGSPVQLADLRIVAIDRHLRFQLFDQVERAASQADRAGMPSRQPDFEKRPHRRTMRANKIEPTRPGLAATPAAGPARRPTQSQ